MAMSALDETVRRWISVLLVAYAKTGTTPGSYLGRPGNKMSVLPTEARQLAVELWLTMWPEEDEVTARIWAEVVLQVGERTMYRIREGIAKEPSSERLLGHCRALIETAILPRLTRDLVRAAIEAGWTGCETRGVKPLRETHHLLRLLRGWLPAESRPPERPIPRAEW